MTIRWLDLIFSVVNWIMTLLNWIIVGCCWLIKVTVVDSITMETMVLILILLELRIFFGGLLFVVWPYQRVTGFDPGKRVNRWCPVQKRIVTSLETENRWAPFVLFRLLIVLGVSPFDISINGLSIIFNTQSNIIIQFRDNEFIAHDFFLGTSKISK